MMSKLHWVQEQDARLTRAYLAKIVSEARKNHNVPAVSTTVMDSETVYLQEVQGVRVFDKQGHAALDDYFRIGSCSKSVLALMAARLIEQKKITWQTRFFDLLPELKAEANGAYRDITLEDLFLGEAGIKAFTNAEAEPFPELWSTVNDRRLEFIKYVVKQRPSSERMGEKFQHLYSNAGYTWLQPCLKGFRAGAMKVLSKA